MPTPLQTSIQQAANTMSQALQQASSGLIERDILTELVGLATIASEHLLVIGPPGTAKSAAVHRVAQAMGGQYFEYLIGRFTEPNELFGPVDLQKLREGVVHIDTTNMLPEADFAFLDEVFLGSTAILNTLLGILNERHFRRGHTTIKCPLRICVGAANQLPDDEALRAFADRFLLNIFVEPIADARLEELLEMGQYLEQHPTIDAIDPHILDLLSQHVKTADFSTIRSPLAMAIRQLRSAGIMLTDRRIVKIQHLTAAAAILAGRLQPNETDLWPLIYAIPNMEQQQLGREVLHDLLTASENENLAAAAADASLGPQARASKLTQTGHQLLAERPTESQALANWHLKLEGIAREIDAGFSQQQMPEALSLLRQQIVTELT